MSVTAKALIQARYAPTTLTAVYAAPLLTTTLIDKFTATNTDGSAQTVSVHLVPSGDSVAAQNVITSARSIAAGASVDLPELKNHILNPGDTIYVVASAAGKLVVRLSGREVLP